MKGIFKEMSTVKYREELLWILDKVGNEIYETERESSEEEYQQNIDFVHSLGEKCDCVGWSKLDLSSDRANGILDRIEEFCKENGWRARGYYKREYYDFESEWYMLSTPGIAYNAIEGTEEIPDSQGKEMLAHTLKAYHISPPAPYCFGRDVYIPERVRNAFIDVDASVDFLPVKDVGRYRAERYFTVHPKIEVAHMLYGKGLYYSLEPGDEISSLPIYGRLISLGGALPRLCEIFYALNAELPECYLASDMPSGGTAYAFTYDSGTIHSAARILLHRDVAEALIGKGAITRGALVKLPITESTPAGYISCKTYPLPRPCDAYVAECRKNHDALQKKPRPERRISEKLAKSVLRRAKRTRVGDLEKALGRSDLDSLCDTPLAPLIPYYSITARGFISFEYELLSPLEAMAESERFARDMKKEELLCDTPTGIVFAVCADGDRILLTEGGGVIRFSHEVPEQVYAWDTLAQFIYDAVLS